MQKTYTAQIQTKSDDPGAVTAVFATLGVVDLDNDVTVRGAFQSGQPVIIEPWNHDAKGLPVGKGVIREEGDKAILDGRIFLDTVNGSEVYRVLKGLGEAAQWSYSFEVLDHDFGNFGNRPVRFLKRLSVLGVGPVSRAAGLGTRTVDLKALARSGLTVGAALGMLAGLEYGLKRSGAFLEPSGVLSDVDDLELELMSKALEGQLTRPPAKTRRDRVLAQIMQADRESPDEAPRTAWAEAELEALVMRWARKVHLTRPDLTLQDCERIVRRRLAQAE